MKTILFLTTFLMLTQLAVAQEKTLDREYVPIMQKTAAAPLFELNVEEWTAFRFDSNANSWSPIPFQFDQLSDAENYDKNADGKTDATDEITFMPSDVGDKASRAEWLDASEAERIEIEVVDPLDESKKGWIYLYKNATTAQSARGYLDYFAGPQAVPAADTIVTDVFKLGHNNNGWIDYLKFSSSDVDIIDRFKMRLKGKSFLIPSYDINEDFVEATTDPEKVAFYNGPVRAFHQTKADILLEKLGIALLPKRSSFKYYYEYTPYSFAIEAETDIDASLLALFGVKLIRQSLDFNEKAIGMTFYSDTNRDGILIDGVVSDYSDVLGQDQQQNWVMATGDQGTVFLIFDMDIMKNSKRSVYFRDQKDNEWTGDDTKNTGDEFSYGDMGVMIRASGDALITDKLSIIFKGYFIDRTNVSANFGEQILAWEQNPVNVNAVLQQQDLTDVTQSEVQPLDFHLDAAYPNPYSLASNKNIILKFSGHRNDYYDLVVYNMIGQQITTFKNLTVDANGRYQLKWDARDQFGVTVAPGVYFVQLQNGPELQTQKLVISR
jgi:hypothetical protein